MQLAMSKAILRALAIVSLTLLAGLIAFVIIPSKAQVKRTVSRDSGAGSRLNSGSSLIV